MSASQVPAQESSELAPALVSFGLGLLVFAILRGPIIFWRLEGYGLVPSGTYLSLAAALILCLGIFLQRGEATWRILSPFGFAALLPVLFFSDWMCHRYSYFQAPSIRGELLCGCFFSFLLLRRRLDRIFGLWLFMTSVLLLVNFFSEAGGSVIFSDDHASVFYRLTLLKKYFPFIPTYDVLWNAGTDARDFFSTGILNLFLLSFPLLKLFSVETLYNPIVASVLFILLPASCFFSFRILGGGKGGAAIAAILSLATTLPWYRWALKYGAMGFVTSAVLVPINLALIAKLLDENEQFDKRAAVCLCVAFTLMIFWTPTGLIFIPALALGLLQARRLLKQRAVRGLLAGLLLLNLPWMLVWMSVANVFGFVGAEHFSGSHSSGTEIDAGREIEEVRGGEEKEAAKISKPHDRRKGKGQSKSIDLASMVRSLRSFAISANPLLIFLGVPGLFLFPWRKQRVLYGLSAAWLLFLGIVLSPLKPQLELERMLVVLGIVLCFPTALAIESILRSLAEKRLGLPFQALASVVCAYLFLGSAATTGIVRNRSLEVYYFSDETVEDIASAIEKFGGAGRALFSGFVLHELDHGHIAPLAYYTKHPIVASSPVHNTWWYTDVIPEYYRDAGPAEIERFFDAMNVTAVFAHEPFWRNYFSSQPNTYRNVWEGGRFKMFQRLSNAGNYFLEGSGEIVSQSGEGLRFKTEAPTGVLKFKYYPFLQASACKLEPYSLPGGLNLIRLTDCPTGVEINIKAISGFSRVFS